MQSKVSDPYARLGNQHGYFYSPRTTAGPPPFPPWRVWEALAVVLLFSLSQPLASLAVSAWLSAGLPEGLTMDQVERELFRIVLPLVIAISHGLGWAGVWWVLVRRHRVGMLRGLRLVELWRFRLVRVFVAGMSLQIVSVLLGTLLPPPEEFSNPMLRFVGYGRWAVAVLFLMAVIMAPFLEEALFRGILLPALRRHLAFVPAAVLVTVLFTGLHAVQTGGYVPAMVAIGIVGYLLAWLREASGSLWPPVIFHMGFNFTALLPVLLLGGRLPEVVPGVG